MTTMKRFFRLFYLTLSVVFCICCNAEEGIPCLAGTEWQQYWPGQIDPTQGELEKLTFYRDSVQYYTYWYPLKDTTVYSKPYYQCDTKPTSFDFSQVGKGNGGKYFVEYNHTLNEMEYCEITKCTEDSLVFFLEWQPGYIGGGDHSVTYTRVR